MSDRPPFIDHHHAADDERVDFGSGDDIISIWRDPDDGKLHVCLTGKRQGRLVVIPSSHSSVLLSSETGMGK